MPPTTKGHGPCAFGNLNHIMFSKTLELFLSWVGGAGMTVCPRKNLNCERCHLRVVCACAQVERAADAAYESIVWKIIVLCAAASIVYAFMGFLT